MPAGKGIVIGITLFFSIASFTLGFFVGKYGADRRPDAPGLSTEPVSAPQPAPIPAPVPAAVQAEQKTAPPRNEQVPEAGNVQEAKPAPQDTPRTQEPVRAVMEPAPRQVKDTAKAPAEEVSPEPAAAKEVKNAVRYTVQIGAFRSKAEAEKCKAKYSRKGYKIYISSVKANRTLTIYKVRTGDFTGKKDAEVLALKLKKTEGLNTFVTPVNG